MNYEAKEYKMTILGDCPSKANSYKIISFNGHAKLGKTKVLQAYEKSFALQCKYRGLDLKEFFSIDVDVYYPNNRKDLDGAWKILLDCLQMNGVIHNDRECLELHSRKMLDKNNPRVEITIRTMAGITTRDSKQPGLFDD